MYFPYGSGHRFRDELHPPGVQRMGRRGEGLGSEQWAAERQSQKNVPTAKAEGESITAGSNGGWPSPSLSSANTGREANKWRILDFAFLDYGFWTSPTE